jgi:hypothetical protein
VRAKPLRYPHERPPSEPVPEALSWWVNLSRAEFMAEAARRLDAMIASKGAGWVQNRMLQ